MDVCFIACGLVCLLVVAGMGTGDSGRGKRVPALLIETPATIRLTVASPSSMTIHGDYRGDHVCAISGATTNLACCTSIQYDVLERKEADVSCCQCM